MNLQVRDRSDCTWRWVVVIDYSENNQRSSSKLGSSTFSWLEISWSKCSPQLMPSPRWMRKWYTYSQVLCHSNIEDKRLHTMIFHFHWALQCQAHMPKCIETLNTHKLSTYVDIEQLQFPISLRDWSSHGLPILYDFHLSGAWCHWNKYCHSSSRFWMTTAHMNENNAQVDEEWLTRMIPWQILFQFLSQFGKELCLFVKIR